MTNVRKADSTGKKGGVEDMVRLVDKGELLSTARTALLDDSTKAGKVAKSIPLKSLTRIALRAMVK